MKPLALALLLLSAPSVRADETAAPPAAAPEAAPAPELLALERVLKEKQEAKSKGQLDPEQYKEFVAKFRPELDAAMERVPSSAENKGAHARILSRLGDKERGQALANLDEALTENPDSRPLLLAKGHIFLEQKNYPAAAESARAAWESSKHTDLGALSLLRLAENRVAPASAPSTTASAPSSPAAVAVAEDSRPYKLASKSRATPSEVPPISPPAETNQSGKKGFGALASIGVISGVLLLAWGAAPQETKDRLRETLWENPKQELKYGAAAVAIGGVAYGGWALMAAAPAAAPAAAAAPTMVASSGAAALTSSGGGAAGSSTIGLWAPPVAFALGKLASMSDALPRLSWPMSSAASADDARKETKTDATTAAQTAKGRKCLPATPANIRTVLQPSTFVTSQPVISAPKVQAYVVMLEQGSEPPPIHVAGNILVNGHHRYVAGLLCGIEVARIPGTAAFSVPTYPIRQIKIDVVDWGN